MADDDKTWMGWDLASGEDYSAIAGAVRDMTFVCEVPRGLGNVTALEPRGNKLIARTESGIELIVPTGPLAK